MAQTEPITLVVPDNRPIYPSLTAQAQWQNWQQQGLFLFMPPQNCSQMNDIAAQWYQIKTHAIAGRIFDNEDDLAVAVIDGMTSCSEQGGYTIELFKLNRTYAESLGIESGQAGKTLVQFRHPAHRELSSMMFTKLNYCQYLLSGQTNFTLTHLAEHLQQ